MLRGFVSGIALAILTAVGVFSAISISNAQGDRNSDPNQSEVWRTSAVTASTTAMTSDTPSDSSHSSTFGPPPDQPHPISAPAQNTVSTGAKTDGYIALGDSVAAGDGLPTWSNATSQDKRCGRSPESYAFEVGRQLNRPHVLFACSGASSGDLFTRQWTSNRNPRIQLNQAFAQGTPAIISITAGANDIGWRRLMERCYSGACGTTTQTLRVDAGLIIMERNLRKALDQIKERSNNSPPIVVLTGYYNPVSQACVAAFPDRVTSSEISWIGQGVNKLNQHLQQIANDSNYSQFVRFAPVDFTSHDLCSSSSWVQGLRDKAPLHPTAAGQQAIARAVVAAVNQ